MRKYEENKRSRRMHKAVGAALAAKMSDGDGVDDNKNDINVNTNGSDSRPLGGSVRVTI